jgi:hypothetical protein
VLWLLGLLGHVGGSLIHLLLVIAVIVLIINLVQGRRGPWTGHGPARTKAAAPQPHYYKHRFAASLSGDTPASTSYRLFRK